MHLLKKIPVQLLITLIVAYIVLPFFSVHTISVFFTFSQILKECLILFLPFIIFFYLSSALSGFNKSAPFLLFCILTMVILSNAATVLTVYGFLNVFIDYLCTPIHTNLVVQQSQILALYELPIKKIVPTEWAMISAFLFMVVRLLLSTQTQNMILNFIESGKNGSTYFLRSFFVPLLPLYVFGYILKLLNDGNLSLLIQHYGKIFFTSIVFIICYSFLFYFLANKGNISKTIETIKNMLPAGITGFSTMSSAATMPLTLEATEKNLKLYNASPAFGRFIIPLTTNIHLIGDGISLSLTALSLLYMSGSPLPNFDTYLVFTFWYCLAKFSTAGVPGAGVIIILPVMQNYLHLDAELSGILTTIYILKDGLLTSANVMGNGGFALLNYNLFKNIFLKQEK